MAPTHSEVQLYSAEGEPLAHRASVSRDGDLVSVTIASGGRKDSQYSPALDGMLARIKHYRWPIRRIYVDPTSGRNVARPISERQIFLDSELLHDNGTIVDSADIATVGRSIRRLMGPITSPGKSHAGANSRLTIELATNASIEALAGAPLGASAIGSVDSKPIVDSDLPGGSGKSNQWGMHIRKRFIAEVALSMLGPNLDESDRHRNVVVIDPDGRRWNCSIKRPPSKDEFYLHGSKELTGEWGVAPGDTVTLTMTAPGEMSIDFDIADNIACPQDVPPPILKGEGAERTRIARFYERKPANRAAALDFHGYRCKACDVLMSDVYGERGDKFIHVHHVIPVKDLTPAYSLNIATDLLPVCPNCHAMIHRREPMLSVEQLREQIHGAAGSRGSTTRR